jgi:inosine-uridine nucleoside N-ribohydrolase
MLMYDQVTVASLVDPSLVTSTEMIVDVDTNHDINYGVSVGGDKPWPGTEGAQRMVVQHDLDWDRFIRMFVLRITQAVP